MTDALPMNLARNGLGQAGRSSLLAAVAVVALGVMSQVNAQSPGTPSIAGGTPVQQSQVIADAIAADVMTVVIAMEARDIETGFGPDDPRLDRLEGMASRSQFAGITTAEMLAQSTERAEGEVEAGIWNAEILQAWSDAVITLPEPTRANYDLMNARVAMEHGMVPTRTDLIGMAEPGDAPNALSDWINSTPGDEVLSAIRDFQASFQGSLEQAQARFEILSPADEIETERMEI